jgi:hypothetical protein
MSDQPRLSGIWSCKIGATDQSALPSGSDAPMRRAVEEAYEALTGHESEFNFSGWNAQLTEGERAVIENRWPRYQPVEADKYVLVDALWQAREALRLTREYVGEDRLPAIEGWSWFDATVLIDALLGIEDETAPPAPEEQ